MTQDGQIQYLPVRTKQQIVSPEDLEAAAHSAVTGRLNEVNHFVSAINFVSVGKIFNSL